MNVRTWSNGLGWFSIGLGILEIAAARPLAAALGLESRALVRAYGVREIVAGIGLLTQRRKGPWIWARLAGDVLDVATLGAGMTKHNATARRNAGKAAPAPAPPLPPGLGGGPRPRADQAQPNPGGGRAPR